MLRRRVQAAVAASAALVAGCVSTPQDLELTAPDSHSMPPAHESALGRVFDLPAEGETSHFAVVDRGDEGLDARLALARVAERSIDVQSYLWHGDAAGCLLLDHILEAADRGVRVRLLVDGFKLKGLEEAGRSLAAHPNVEIRAFNPTLHRAGLWQMVELGENVARYDHRMHNKQFLVDGVVGVFGGRNIGDEYFGLGEEFNFRDMDLLAAGPVLRDLEESFDAYWNSGWAVPLDALVAEEDARGHEEVRERVRAVHLVDPRLDARRAHPREAWLAALERARARMVPGEATVLYDSEDIAAEGATGALIGALRDLDETKGGDVLIVSAYLVPDDAFVEGVRRQVEAGGRMRILTNSLVTNNQPLAHAGYQASRKRLLQAGAELYELRGDAWSHVHHASPGSEATFLGLHAKSAVFGDDVCLVASMNLDPRSMVLNTEMGVVIRSPELAAWLRRCLERELAPRNAWRVDIAPDGRLRWTNDETVQHTEPSPGPGVRIRQSLFAFLPIRGEV